MGNPKTEKRKYKRRHEHRKKFIHNECKFDEEDICVICGKYKWERNQTKRGRENE